AAEHLIDLGHRSLFVLGSPHDDHLDGRWRGTLDALDAAYLPHYPVERCADWSPRAGYQAATRLLETYHDQVTGISCANDETALGAIRAVFDRGMRVPEDVSVTGMDDDPVAAFG